MTSYDAIVIGAGHNGIIAATKLAKSGQRVLVVEAASAHGGMAQGGEFAPGHAGSPLIHSCSGLNEDVIRALAYDHSGIETSSRNGRIICLSEDSMPLVLTSDYSPVSGGCVIPKARTGCILRNGLNSRLRSSRIS